MVIYSLIASFCEDAQTVGTFSSIAKANEYMQKKVNISEEFTEDNLTILNYPQPFCIPTVYQLDKTILDNLE